MQYILPMQFGNFPADITDPAKAKAVIVPAPYGGTLSFLGGTERAPEKILEVSAELEPYDDELGDVWKAGINTQGPLSLPKDPEKAIDAIYNHIKSLDKFPILLGGGHSLSIGAVKAMSEKHDKLSVLQLDAHADLYDRFEGSSASHACTMARIREICPYTGVGIRSLSFEGAELIRKENIPIFYARDIHDSSDWHDKTISNLTKNVYITIDADVFDPSIMTVGTPEPGGLGYYEALGLLKKVCQGKNVVGFDIMEYRPTDDPAPAMLLVRLIYKLIGYTFIPQH